MPERKIGRSILVKRVVRTTRRKRPQRAPFAGDGQLWERAAANNIRSKTRRGGRSTATNRQPGKKNNGPDGRTNAGIIALVHPG